MPDQGPNLADIMNCWRGISHIQFGLRMLRTFRACRQRPVSERVGRLAG